jgi:hypothetical protein
MQSPSRGDHYRAELLWALGAPEQAREADRRALDLIANPAQLVAAGRRCELGPEEPRSAHHVRASPLERDCGQRRVEPHVHAEHVPDVSGVRHDAGGQQRDDRGERDRAQGPVIDVVPPSAAAVSVGTDSARAARHSATGSEPASSPGRGAPGAPL